MPDVLGGHGGHGPVKYIQLTMMVVESVRYFYLLLYKIINDILHSDMAGDRSVGWSSPVNRSSFSLFFSSFSVLYIPSFAGIVGLVIRSFIFAFCRIFVGDLLLYKHGGQKRRRHPNDDHVDVGRSRLIASFKPVHGTGQI